MNKNKRISHRTQARLVHEARMLENMAMDCITIAQRLLPNTNDSIIEDQATDLMDMTEDRIRRTLQRLQPPAELVPINEEIKKENPKVNLKTRFQILKIK